MIFSSALQSNHENLYVYKNNPTFIHKKRIWYMELYLRRSIVWSFDITLQNFISNISWNLRKSFGVGFALQKLRPIETQRKLEIFIYFFIEIFLYT